MKLTRKTVWVGDIRVERIPMIGGGVNYAAWRRDPKGLLGDYHTITHFEDDPNSTYGKVNARTYDGPDHAYGSSERIAVVKEHYARGRAEAIAAIQAAFPEAEDHEMQV